MIKAVSIFGFIIRRTLEAAKTAYMVGWRWLILSTLLVAFAAPEAMAWHNNFVILPIMVFFGSLVTGYNLYMFPLIRMFTDSDIIKYVPFPQNAH